MREQDIYKQFSKILAEIDGIKKDLKEILNSDLSPNTSYDDHIDPNLTKQEEARNELNKAITKGTIK